MLSLTLAPAPMGADPVPRIQTVNASPSDVYKGTCSHKLVGHQGLF